MKEKQNNKSKKIELTFVSNLSDQKFIGEQSGNHDGDKFIESLNTKIAEILTNTMENFGNDWIVSFENLIIKLKFREAYEILNSNQDRLQFCTNTNVLNLLLKMDLEILNKVERLNFLKNAIALSHKFHLPHITSNYVNRILHEFSSELEPLLLENLELEQANQAARDKKFNLAYNLYNQILTKTAENSTKAWIYRGLSIIAPTPTEYERYAMLSFDLFLTSGNKEQAITELIGLSNFYFNIDPEKCIFYINEAINILQPDNPLNKERQGSLRFHLAKTYLEQNKIEKAKSAIDESINLRENLIGNLQELCSTYYLAKEISQKLGNNDEVQLYSEKIDKIHQSINDPIFNLKIEVITSIENFKTIPIEFLSKIENQPDVSLIISSYILFGLNKNLPNHERFKFLDLAIEEISKIKIDTEILSLAYYSLGKLYKEDNNSPKSIEFILKSLDIHPYRLSAIADLINLYIEMELWSDLTKFLNSKIEIYGEYSHLNYLKALALHKNGNETEALALLSKLDGDQNLKPKIDDLILECVKNGGTKPVFQSIVKPNSFNIFDFRSILCECAESISTKSRMHFWKYNKEKRKHSWIQSPEETAKQLIIQYLTGKLSYIDFEILEEIKVSAGRMDLYIKGATQSFIIELKICGESYSSTYALTGEDQLLHYMKGKKLYTAFLFVFDGRTRDQGKHFIETKSIGEYTIYTIVCDLNPNVL
ncbi:tetratricopeptide repeat protein [Leptospira vanthielii]|uniref:Uncharacterized protein n=1 Tax=Leptospira vanthielii serovar Holland str. Waz Holland = ATCC 700522 TaxID=1218591 RepID=N1WB12_9LEPT|nr:hypothetical protein [Leptospira vanthielii]EMY70605.1 hypothetical protein LEP1GSC199_1620 [Leptospira vanthielii serovar Holland str. Waz Holland = ATCC 700522]